MDSYKIAFIHQNATIDYVGSNTTDDTHSVHLLEYAKNNYPEVSIFKKLNYRHTPETISYFYTLLGDVIFLNTTKDVERHGYTGLFIFPQKITEEQKRILTLSILEEWTSKEIAIKFGKSDSRIRHIIKDTIAKIKQEYEGE